MTDLKHSVITTPRGNTVLWPDSQYYAKLEKLKLLIGRKIYLIEAVVTEINAGIHHTGQAYTLLAIVDYPQPDPKTGLLPHNIILDDGRGINLGRIIQISIESAFTSVEKNIIYRNDILLDNLLPHYNPMDKKSLTQISKTLLANILGETKSVSVVQKISNKTD